jgi:hypothetical protein
MEIMVTRLGFGFNFPALMAQYTAEPVSTEKKKLRNRKRIIEEKISNILLLF